MTTPHITTLRTALETAYINGATASSLAYRPQVVSNNHKEGKKGFSIVNISLWPTFYYLSEIIDTNRDFLTYNPFYSARDLQKNAF